MRVFVTGGTGLIGTRLIRHLRNRQDEVVALSRRADAALRIGADCEVVQGDPMQAGPWQDKAAECDAIVNLAGEGIFNKRWSTAFKTLLRDSRVKSTTNCAQAISRSPKRADGSPKVLVNASAVGFYGPRGDEEIDESSLPGSDFLAGLCADWERAAKPARNAGARLVLVRTGVVLDKEGGALKQLLFPFKMGGGGPAGSGKQYMPWIHHADEVGLFAFALENSAANGPMNATAPNPVTNKQFGKALGRALHRPAIMWTPGFMLKLMLGQAAEVVTTGQNVLPGKALQWGYKFQFSTIDAAIADILK
jgi:uncharacterized protein (TIGR01777 family)